MKLIQDIIAIFELLPFDSKIAFIISIILILLSLTLFYRNKKHTVLFLFLGGISLGVGFALIDPFFHLWDEKFHALVAKNLSETPLHPRLLNTDVVNYDNLSWVQNYTWLHKPPLSLWQIALSIKLFGANLMAVRAPSILLHVLTSVLVYRIGVNTFTRRTAYFAALVYLFLNYNLELVAGVHTADHIDVAFTFYITASIWAFINYQNSKNTKWIYLIGVFVGFAILTKWLVGLLVFSGWGVYLIVYYKENPLIEWKRMFFVLFVSIVVAAPWFIYASLNYPVEFQHEMSYNTLHFTGVIEGHEGDMYFYWSNLKTLFGDGDLVSWLILISVLFLWKTAVQKKYALFFYVWILLVYFFFTLARTKMTGFVNIVSPLVILAVVSFIMKSFSFLKSKIKFRLNRVLLCSINVVLLLTLFASLVRPNKVMNNHLLNAPHLRGLRLEQQNFVKNRIPGKPKDFYFFEKYPLYTYIDIMFHYPSAAYNRLPSDEEVNKLSKLGYTIYVVYGNKKPRMNSSKIKYLKYEGIEKASLIQ